LCQNPEWMPNTSSSSLTLKNSLAMVQILKRKNKIKTKKRQEKQPSVEKRKQKKKCWLQKKKIYQSVFDFSSAQSVATDIDNVIHPSCDLEITITVSDSPITREIEPVIWPIVSVQKPFVASVNRSGHSRPGLLHTQSSRDIILCFFMALFEKEKKIKINVFFFF